MTLVPWPLCSLTQSLMEKEQKLLVLQEAESVHQQELSSLRQDVQEARGEWRELSAQVLPTPLVGPVPRQRPAPGVEKPVVPDPPVKRTVLLFRIPGCAGTVAALAGGARQDWAGWGLGNLTQS